MAKVGRGITDSPGRILEHLTKRGPSSVLELSQELTLTGVTVRHHLGELRRQGLLATPVPRRRAVRGRPVLTYSVTHRAHTVLAENHLEFAVHVLLAAREQLSPSDLERLMATAGERLGRLREGSPALTPRARRRQALRFLNDRGYFPSYSTLAGSERVTLAHCPYLIAAESCPAVCAFDRALVRSLFGAEVSLASRIVDRDPACVFEFEELERFDRAAMG